MGEAAFDHDSPFSASGARAAAVLCRTEEGTLHAGVLHRGTGGVAAVLHLGWEDRLYIDWRWHRLWATPEVQPEKLMAAAGHCRRIWRTFNANGVFPYALAFCGSRFDDRGRLQLGPGSRGLTCATFILAIFETCGVSLVNEDDWPVRTAEDLAFIQTIADAGFAREEHLALLRDEATGGCTRIQPHEVVGACAVVELPARFAPTADAAHRVLAKLDG